MQMRRIQETPYKPHIHYNAYATSRLTLQQLENPLTTSVGAASGGPACL
jgi:hypothetical protein